MAKRSPLSYYVSGAVRGALVHARASHCGIDITNLDPKSEADRRTILDIDNDILEYGICVDCLTQNVLNVLFTLVTDETLSKNVISSVSIMLWRILGDPDSGDPPKIYVRAARDIYEVLTNVVRDSTLDAHP